jgi:hypothetical protein
MCGFYVLKDKERMREREREKERERERERERDGKRTRDQLFFHRDRQQYPFLSLTKNFN